MSEFTKARERDEALGGFDFLMSEFIVAEGEGHTMVALFKEHRKTFLKALNKAEALEKVEGMKVVSEARISKLKWWQHTSGNYLEIAKAVKVYNTAIDDILKMIKECE